MNKNTNNEIINALANVELSAKCVFHIAEKYALHLTQTATLPCKILIGKDTRASSDMIEAALSAAFCSKGVNAVSLGIIPTPALSYLIKKYKVSGGVAISASTRSSDYNGLTFFNSNGDEISKEDFDKIPSDYNTKLPQNCDMGRITRSHTALRDYVDHIKSTAYADLSGLKLAIDVAYGAGFESCKIVFKELGADVDMLHNIPNGKNINDNCGINHPEIISQYVPAHKCSAGITFDGAGHSFIAVDENGRILSQDDVERICTQYGNGEKETSCNCGLASALNFICALKNSEKRLSQL